MGRRTKAQRLTNRINDARNAAGLDPIHTTLEALTLQQVESEADSLHIPAETLLIDSRAA